MTTQSNRPTPRSRSAQRPQTPEVPGVNYQRLVRWAAEGHLRPGRERPNGKPTRGNRYVWPNEELRIAEDMGRLTAVGVLPEPAAENARVGRARVEAILRAFAGSYDQ